ncbi:MAG: glycosyltransferase WbuB [Sphingomonas bacterium]|uniref:glycosyltransferase family 4 protein n=1 Tax=Sphingomonas bacterium TaxID=1895847 RepID=UPI002633690C|nr:glycosyltransferase family 4 protein [Sphingomonas bacterium]MDB5706579.1 glycosyltransferase WbuB [Sphingomonas bacterium]
MSEAGGEAAEVRKRFLMVCMQFPTGPGESYMTTELADALVAAGHRVEVLFLNWAAPIGAETREYWSPGGVRVVECAPAAVTGLGGMARAASKFMLSGRHLAREARQRFDLASFDAAIAWMPAIAIAPLVPLLARAGIRHRILFIWDFFPDHHREIGRIPGGPAYWIARAWEQRLLRRFTAIVCTLPGNAAYLRRTYRIEPAQRVLVTPIWSDTTPRPAVDRASIRARHDLPGDRPIAIFGGQIVEGRGFEQMLGAADAAAAAGSPLLFLFIGDGRLAPMIRERAARQDNIRHLPGVSRAAYLELVGACDVGMVATVPGVTSFSIPTKTIDYLRAGIPVIAAVEHGSDFIAMLTSYDVGVAVPFNEPGFFFREAERLATDPAVRARMAENAPRCLDEVFDVRHALATLLDAARD